MPDTRHPAPPRAALLLNLLPVTALLVTMGLVCRPSAPSPVSLSVAPVMVLSPALPRYDDRRCEWLQGLRRKVAGYDARMRRGLTPAEAGAVVGPRAAAVYSYGVIAREVTPAGLARHRLPPALPSSP